MCIRDRYIATALEIYVTGSLNVFNHHTNVDVNSRIVCYDIKMCIRDRLYAASARAAQAMGYRKIITYTLHSESGSSLRAAGWSLSLIHI